ncbi:MAG: hypothetical protein ACUVUR_00540 [bacterium]
MAVAEEPAKTENRKQTAKTGKDRLANQTKVLAELEQRCGELGLRVVYDDLHGEGGMCRLRNQYLVIINRRASAPTRIRMLEQALKKYEAVKIEPRPVRPTMSTSRPPSG